MGIETIASQGMVAKYKARFKPTAAGDYLFSSNDYGMGVPCSKEKYHAYADEFELFVAIKMRFMKRWVIAVLLVAIIVMILAVPYGSIEFIDRWEIFLQIGWALLVVLPLVFIYIKGWSLYKKPAQELDEPSNPVKRKQNSADIRDKRLNGMPAGIPFLGILVVLVGLYLSYTDENYGSIYFDYFCVIGLIFFVVIAIMKYGAYRRYKRLLEKSESMDDESYMKNTQPSVSETTKERSDADPKGE